MEDLVTVGVDGSPSALAAVEAAAQEAALRGAGLRIVHAFVWPGLHVPPGSTLGPAHGPLRERAEALVTRAVERARSAAPQVEVESAIVAGETATVLIARSEAARLLVVGAPDTEGATDPAVSSMTEHLTGHARCPVMVVRGRASLAGPVVLGVDLSTAGRAAAGFALLEASLRHQNLVALHVREEGIPPDPQGHEHSAPAQRAVRAVLSEHLGRHPEVAVEVRVVSGDARSTLVTASHDAGLLVTGTRGHGGLLGMLLGSVSRSVLRHARCPVAVVRPDGDGP
ncbi:universal stress protein [Streptomyces sp. CC208A]|uniref:universal stress protein n=1 Tax=Streptomyces sp. CC208A TaxID=3044573 RepID=UPI0024A803BD|nr:universal stress protein [Streptomyces sp. CC208A]